MNRAIVRFEQAGSGGCYRTIFQTRHGRSLYLELSIAGSRAYIANCFYTDRNQSRTGKARFSARPKKLQTLHFAVENLLSVIESELDRKFYGVEFIETGQASLSLEEYLRYKAQTGQRKYRFLILVGEGECRNGLPLILRTRLKTKLHRAVYVELAYYKDGKGVVSQCYYYDREYKRQGVRITPPMLISCFFPYTKEGILSLINREICCDFTHILVTEGLDLDSNTTPLCEAI